MVSLTLVTDFLQNLGPLYAGLAAVYIGARLWAKHGGEDSYRLEDGQGHSVKFTVERHAPEAERAKAITQAITQLSMLTDTASK